jgi:GTP-binding protein
MSRVELETTFWLSATHPDQFPRSNVPEISFLGRSNVGKSSLLNAIVGQKRLAFTSSTPGRTQTVNYYRVGDEFVFVDLPGYGFAKAPRALASEWQQMIESYLLQKSVVPGLAVALIDSRRGWMEKDLQLKEWLEFHGKPYVVVATKADKLNQKERQESQKAIRTHYPDGDLIWFSAVNGQGVKEVWQAIWKTRRA